MWHNTTFEMRNKLLKLLIQRGSYAVGVLTSLLHWFWVLIRIYCTFSESKLKTAAALHSHISTGAEYLILKAVF